jgi:hypothetical protein
VLQTLDAMRRDSVAIDEPTSQQLVHMFCSSQSWGDALAVLDDLARLAEGGSARSGSNSSSSGKQASGSSGGGGKPGAFDKGWLGFEAPDAAAGAQGEEPEWRWRRYNQTAIAPATHQSAAQAGAGQGQPPVFYPPPPQQHQQRERWAADGRGAAGNGAAATAKLARPKFGLASDALWHIVLRQLTAASAPDGVVTAFVSRMSPTQLRRFARMYPLRRAADGVGWSVVPEGRVGVMPASMRAGTGKAAAGADGKQGEGGGGAFVGSLEQAALAAATLTARGGGEGQ